MARAVEVLIASLALVVALFTGLVVVDDLVTAREATSGDVRVERAEGLLEGPGTYVDVADGAVGYDETVYQTTGYAMNFTGAPDSELSATGVYDFGNDTSWHVSVWAHPDVGTGTDVMKVTSVSDGELIVYYNGTAGHWAAWYYRADTRNSYEATVPTQHPQGNLTNVQVKANDTHLAIYRNATVGDEVAITGDNSVDSPTAAGNFDGRVEELRVFDEPADATNRSELYNSPTEQQPDLDRALRVMYDQPDRPETLLLIAGGEATASNVTFSAGFPEDRMQRKNLTNDLAGTSDYRFDSDGPRIAPVSGGELDGAPVAYVDYYRPETQVSLTGLMNSWVQLAALIPLVLVATAIAARVRQ